MRSQGKRPPGIRREILDVAAVLLSRRGYDGTTIRAIAAEVGIKAGSIYHHFASKDELVQDVLDTGVILVRDAVETALAALPSDADARQRLKAAIEAHLRAFLEHGAYTSASVKVFPLAPGAVRAKSRDIRKEYEAIWRNLVADLVEQGWVNADCRADTLRLMLLGAMNWAAEWYRPERLSVAEIAEDYTRIVAGQTPATAAHRAKAPSGPESA